jgi:hypothetical protein
MISLTSLPYALSISSLSIIATFSWDFLVHILLGFHASLQYKFSQDINAGEFTGRL